MPSLAESMFSLFTFKSKELLKLLVAIVTRCLVEEGPLISAIVSPGEYFPVVFSDIPNGA